MGNRVSGYASPHSYPFYPVVQDAPDNITFNQDGSIKGMCVLQQEYVHSYAESLSSLLELCINL